MIFTDVYFKYFKSYYVANVIGIDFIQLSQSVMIFSKSISYYTLVWSPTTSYFGQCLLKARKRTWTP